MTKENRVNVFDQIKSWSDLRVGDRITFKAKLGEDMRMNSSFTYGGIKDGKLITIDGEAAASHVVFGNTIAGWDSTEWQVWREVPKFPTAVGSIIWIERSLDGAPVGRYRKNRQGGFTSLDSREFVIWANQIKEWSNVSINNIEN